MAKDTENKEKGFESSNYYNIGNLGGVTPNTGGKKYPGQAPGYYDPLAAGGVQVTRGGTYERPILPMEDFGAFQRGLASTYKPPVAPEQQEWKELEFDWENVRSDEDDFFRTADTVDAEGNIVKGNQYEVKAPPGLENRVKEGIIADLEKQWNNCTEIDKRCRDVVLKHVAGVTSINTNLQTLVGLADGDLNDINISAKYLPGIDGTPNKDGLTFAQYARITNESPENINYGTQENEYGETQYGIWVYDKESKKKTFINTSAVNEQYAAKHYKIKYDQSNSIQQAVTNEGSMKNMKDLISRRNDFVLTKDTIANTSIEFGGKKVEITKNEHKYINPDYYNSSHELHTNGANAAFTSVNDPNFPSAWHQLMNKFKEGKTTVNFGQFYNDDPNLRYPVRHPNAGEVVPSDDKTTDSPRWGLNPDRTSHNGVFLNNEDFKQLKKELGFEANMSQEDLQRELQRMDTGKWNNVSKELMLKLVKDNWAEESKILNDNFGYIRDTNGRAIKRNDWQYRQDTSYIALRDDAAGVVGSAWTDQFNKSLSNVLSLRDTTMMDIYGKIDPNEFTVDGGLGLNSEFFQQGFRSSVETLKPVLEAYLPKGHVAIYGERNLIDQLKLTYEKDDNESVMEFENRIREKVKAVKSVSKPNADLFIIKNVDKLLGDVAPLVDSYNMGAESLDQLGPLVNTIGKYNNSVKKSWQPGNPVYNTEQIINNAVDKAKPSFKRGKSYEEASSGIIIDGMSLDAYAKKNNISEKLKMQITYRVLKNNISQKDRKTFLYK